MEREHDDVVAADEVAATNFPPSTLDVSRFPCLSGLASNTLITRAGTAFTQQNIAVWVHSCGILYFLEWFCVILIACVSAARKSTLSIAAYVTVVHAVSKIFCTPRCALFVNWLPVWSFANNV